LWTSLSCIAPCYNLSKLFYILKDKGNHYRVSGFRCDKKSCSFTYKLQLWFSRLRQRLFLKLLRQRTHKIGRFLSTLKHSHPIFICIQNRVEGEFVYQIKIGCDVLTSSLLLLTNFLEVFAIFVIYMRFEIFSWFMQILKSFIVVGAQPRMPNGLWP
jgi:hypothetical protein